MLHFFRDVIFQVPFIEWVDPKILQNSHEISRKISLRIPPTSFCRDSGRRSGHQCLNLALIAKRSSFMERKCTQQLSLGSHSGTLPLRLKSAFRMTRRFTKNRQEERASAAYERVSGFTAPCGTYLGKGQRVKTQRAKNF